MPPLNAPPRTATRRDPAPSRLRYKLNRLWLRPGIRRLVNIGLPALAGLLAAWTLMAQFDARGWVTTHVAALREAIVDRPQFSITSIDVPDVSADLAEQIRVAAFVPLPANSLEVDVNAVRDRVEALGSVERARVRALSTGVLEIRAIERVPAVVWRDEDGLLRLLDRDGVRVAEIDSRVRRIDLPLIAGQGANTHVPEALALIAAAGPLADRLRGLARIGERRWDLVLDRDQTIRLPETGAEAALAHVMALEAKDHLLERDVTVVDMRDPRRPALRLTEFATEELARKRAHVAGDNT